MKVIPAIDIMGGEVVRLVKGDPANKTVYSSNPVDTAKMWEQEGADMLHVVDLDAALGMGSNLKAVRGIVEATSIPVEVAGGLRTEDAIAEALGFAPRVVLGTFAFKKRDALREVSRRYGSERIVISADQRGGDIVVSGWRESTGLGLVQGLEQFVGMGFSDFLITSVDRDGTLGGPDLGTLRKACAVPGARVIASGGMSGLKDAIDVKAAGAAGVILGKALYDGKITIAEVREVA